MGLRLHIMSAFLTASLVSGCHSSEVGQRSGVERKSVFSHRYIKAVYSEPLSLDPAQMNDTSSLLASNLIYDGLLAFTPNLEIRGALAESWTTSRDGRNITFRLRRGTQFHDGTPVTPDSVVASFRRLVAPNSKVFSYYDCIEGADDFHQGRSKELTGVRKLNNEHLEIRLKYPFPPFLSVLAGATAKVLPLSAGLDPAFFRSPVGSGPFRVVGRNQEQTRTDTVLARFDSYYGIKPKLKELVLRAMGEKEALAQAKLGTIHDLANFPLTGAEEPFSFGQHVATPVAATWIIGLNARIAPFDRLEVRRRFRAAINAEEFRKTFHPDALPANGYIPPGLPGYQSKYGEVAGSEISPQAIGKSKIKIAVPIVLARAQEIKRFLDNSLRAQGWNAEVVLMEWDALMKGYSNKKLQAFLVSMNMDYPDTEFLVRNFDSTNPDSFSGLKDSEVDRMIRLARATQDRVERQRLYVDLVANLRKAAVTVDLFHPRGHVWLHRYVRGFEPSILADVYIDYRSISLDSTCLAKLGGGK